MKKTILTLAVSAAIFGTSCKKDADFVGDDLPKIEYYIQCSNCVVELQTKSGKKKYTVKGSENVTTYTKKKIVDVVATGKEYINLSVTLNDNLVYSGSKDMKNGGKVIFNINTQVK